MTKTKFIRWILTGVLIGWAATGSRLALAINLILIFLTIELMDSYL
jgi:hypothetical protein